MNLTSFSRNDMAECLPIVCAQEICNHFLLSNAGWDWFDWDYNNGNCNRIRVDFK